MHFQKSASAICLPLVQYKHHLTYLVPDVEFLSEVDDAIQLADQSSTVEQVFAIDTHHIKINEKGRVLNQKHAMNRAAQFIIALCHKSKEAYQVTPEFEPWEIELH